MITMNHPRLHWCLWSSNCFHPLPLRGRPPPRPGSSKNNCTDDNEDDGETDAMDVDSPAKSFGAAKQADAMVLDSPKATIPRQQVTNTVISKMQQALAKLPIASAKRKTTATTTSTKSVSVKKKAPCMLKKRKLCRHWYP